MGKVSLWMFVTVLLLLLGLTPASWAQSLVAAVLPSSRSIQVGTAATAFATIINTASTPSLACGLAPLSSVPASFHFQTTNPVTNQITGTPDTPVDIPAGAGQSFVFAFTPTGPFPPTDVALSFDCANTDPAPSISGLNSLLLSASTSPVPDIVALAATVKNDGIVDIPGPNTAGAFAVATVNVGASGLIMALADTGGATLPVSLSICQTNPTTGACLAPPTTSVATQIAANATPTFGIFVHGTGPVSFSPALNRVVVRFQDSLGVARGATSVAVRMLLPDVRGTYAGSGTVTQTNCQNPANNGTFGFTGSINIQSQVGDAFNGSGTLDTTNLSSTGTVTTGGQASGTFTFMSLATSGDGIFAGSVSGNTLSFNFSSQVRVGETCTGTGSFTGTR